MEEIFEVVGDVVGGIAEGIGSVGGACIDAGSSLFDSITVLFSEDVETCGPPQTGTMYFSNAQLSASITRDGMHALAEITSHLHDNANTTDWYFAYPYGSRVYGTSQIGSDTDQIVIYDGIKPDVDLMFLCHDTTLYHVSEFERLIAEHEISVLECIMLGSPFQHSRKFEFKLAPEKLRQSCAAKASNSWVKAKKKMTSGMGEDYNPYVGKKSAWHAIRITDFACQILEHGTIVDFTSMNYIYPGILACDSFEEVKEKFDELYREKRSKLRSLAPKPVL